MFGFLKEGEMTEMREGGGGREKSAGTPQMFADQHRKDSISYSIHYIWIKEL